LTRDPETRYTSAGIAVTRFSLAINRPSKKDGQNEADFIRVVAWRKLAEICNEYLRKGKIIAIEGRLQFGSYEKNGQKLQTAEVVADNMQMLDRKQDGHSAEHGAPVPAAEHKEEVVPF
jgi:single-strand DNA-binding protein